MMDSDDSWKEPAARDWDLARREHGLMPEDYLAWLIGWSAAWVRFGLGKSQPGADLLRV